MKLDLGSWTKFPEIVIYMLVDNLFTTNLSINIEVGIKKHVDIFQRNAKSFGEFLVENLKLTITESFIGTQK